MSDEAIPKEILKAAERNFRFTALATMNWAVADYLMKNPTIIMADLALRIGVNVDAFEKILADPATLTLDDISDVLLSVGCYATLKFSDGPNKLGVKEISA